GDPSVSDGGHRGGGHSRNRVVVWGRTNAAYVSGADLAVASLMALGWVALQTVNHPRLGCAQRDPVLHVLLKRDVELLVKFLGLLLKILFAVELELIGELSHQRHMLAASAPQRHIALAQHAFAEVELTEFQENLLDNPFVHQADLLVI